MPSFFHAMNWSTANAPRGPFQLLRLLRLARLGRLLRFFPELVTMIKGMLLATRAVGSAMMLLIIACYAASITMHSFMKEEARERRDIEGDDLYFYWGTVANCMMTLLANGTLGDSIGSVLRIIEHKPEALITMLAFIAFSMLTVLNMLVGMLCEVVTQVAHDERDAKALAKLKSSLLVMLKRIDVDGSGDISKSELLGLLQDDAAVAVMDELNIDVDYFVDNLEMHYHNRDVKIPQIMTLLIDSQGDRQTRVADLCAFSTFSHWTMETMVDTVHVEMESLKKALDCSSQMMHTLSTSTRNSLHCPQFPANRQDLPELLAEFSIEERAI